MSLRFDLSLPTYPEYRAGSESVQVKAAHQGTTDLTSSPNPVEPPKLLHSKKIDCLRGNF